MPIPHEEMRRVIKRRIQGKEGTERIQVLYSLLAEFPGYYTGPYGELRKWVHQLIDEATLRRSVKHRDEFHVPKDGCAQVVLVGPTNAGKSTLLRALTGRPVVDLIWSLLDRIRVWPAPKGKRAAEPVVLPTDSTVADFVGALDGRWQDRFRHARVTGPSARFPSQAVGLGHHLADGDEVDVALAP